MKKKQLYALLIVIITLVVAVFIIGPVVKDFEGSSIDRAANCTITDLEGTWFLESQSTWNEITIDSNGKVTGGRHPHGVKSITGHLIITENGQIDGNYVIHDEESLSYTPPTPPGIWSYNVSGYMHADKEHMTLDYTLEYTPQGEPTETYTGAWEATKQ